MHMNFALLVCSAVLLSAALVARGDLLDCEDQLPKVPGLSEISDIGPKIIGESASSAEHEVRDFFKNVGCQIKRGATKVGEQAKKLGVELKAGAKKLGEKAKDLGSDIKTRFVDFKDKLSKDSLEEISNERSFLANVETINPDILKSEQQCGHGHILDALGNCSKLRK